MGVGTKKSKGWGGMGQLEKDEDFLSCGPRDCFLWFGEFSVVMLDGCGCLSGSCILTLSRVCSIVDEIQCLYS